MPGPLLTGKHLLAVYVEGRACQAPTVAQKINPSEAVSH